jgi:hypothetical protein
MMTNPEIKSVRAALGAATCALLGCSLPGAVDAQEVDAWNFDTALLYYGENDNRVQDASLAVLARRSLLDDRTLSLGLTVDTLTGATPSGAITQAVPQTMTRPSGKDVYTVPAGELPLDDTFHDTRVAVSAGWQQPLTRLTRLDLGFSGSWEYDYSHLGLQATLARDFNQRNTTLSAGMAYSMDEVDPVGGTPAALSPMGDVGDLGNRSGPQDKDVVDVVFGLTQVISRNTLLQLNYSYSDSSGYLTDPYKVLSLVDAGSGDTLPRTVPPGIEGPSHQYLFESRPDTRKKHSFYGELRTNLGGSVLGASYRYMTDDWGIDSHTLDLHYRWPFGAAHYLEPHFRYYTQSAADFWNLSLVDGQPLPEFVSADFRLGEFDAITAGLKYGWTSSHGNEFNIRLEYYQQSGAASAEQLIGNQASRDNFPKLDAVILQFGYQFSLGNR